VLPFINMSGNPEQEYFSDDAQTGRRPGPSRRMIGTATAITRRDWLENGWGQLQKLPYTGSLTSKSCLRATSVRPQAGLPETRPLYGWIPARDRSELPHEAPEWGKIPFDHP
jgi:hypothetical protein